MNSISKKALAGYLLVLLATVVASAVLFVATNNVKHQSNLFRDSTLPEFLTIQETKNILDKLQIDAYALYGTTLNAESFNKRLKQGQQTITRNLSSDGNLAGYSIRGDVLKNAEQLLAELVALETTMTKSRVNWDAAREVLASMDKKSSALNEEFMHLQDMIHDNTEIASAGINTDIGKIRLFIVALLLSVIAFTALAYFYTRKQIANPIVNLSSELDTVAQNYDLTVSVPEVSNDEIGDAAQSVNRLLTAFNEGLKEVRTVANDICSLVSVLGNSSEQADTQVKKLHSRIEYIVEKMFALEQQIEQSFERSHGASDIAKRGADEVHRGAQEVEETSEGIASLANDIEHSSEMLNQLKSSGDQVSIVVGTIAEIAEQTNLLALNAAIEAARAGESGRGFAVVADEVRTLATRTHDSTNEINSMLETIVSSISKVVDSMENNESQANKAVSLAKQTVESLSQIKTTILSLSDESEVVATLANDSRNQVIAMRSEVDQFKSVGDSVFECSQETRDSASMMGELANNLNQSVDKFKT